MHLVGARDVHESARVCVVAVERETLERHASDLRVGDSSHYAFDLLREADADRVAQGDLVAAEFEIGARHFGDTLRGHRSLIRAARDARHVSVRSDPLKRVYEKH